MNKILLHDRNGDKWIFRRDEKFRLCYTINSSEQQILLADIREDFDIITDADGGFHLIIQADDGSLVYLRYDFVSWKKYIILRSRSNRGVMKNFKMIIPDGKPACFYILEIDGKRMLVHHTITPGVQDHSPEVISYISAKSTFSCTADGNGNIHLFFRNISGDLTYKICTDGEFSAQPLPTDDDIRDIKCIWAGNLHLLYTAGVKSYCTLVYFNMQTQVRKIISFGDTNISDFCLYSSGKLLHIQWRERTRFCHCESADGGATFKKPAYISETHGRRAEITGIRSAANPMCHESSEFVILWDGGRANIPDMPPTPSPPKPSHKRESPPQSNNASSNTLTEEIRLMQAELRENRKEIMRLHTIVNTLSDKTGALIRNSTAERESAEKTPDESNNILEEINEENYEQFNSTDIENVNFENSKIFSEE